MIPFVQTAEQLIIVRLLTGFGLGFAITAPFPVAAELMPAQHRRTYGAIYEICLASAFARCCRSSASCWLDNPNGFRWIALPGGLAMFVVPVARAFHHPAEPALALRRGQTQAAVDTVNHFIRRCGNRVPPLTVADLGPNLHEASEQLPPFGALVRARSIALDRGRHPDQHLCRHCLLPDRDPVAESAD